MSPIIFLTSEENKSIACEYQQVNLIKRKKKLIDFNLWVSCSYNDYQTISKNNFLNLIPQVRSSLLDNFNEQHKIELKLRLNKKLVTKIFTHFQQAEEISKYLIRITNQEQKQTKLQEDALKIATQKNWYCLEIKQIAENEIISYYTLWNQIQFPKNDDKLVNNQKKKSRNNFWNEEQISEQWEETGEKISGFFDELIETFDRNISNINQNNQPISQIVKDFLLEDNWNYLQLKDGKTLQLTCQGNNGQITCYARSYDQQNQFIFYSLYPQVIDENKRDTIARLITKINYGMIIGNFEMDFDDGELRYKTSIDLENDRYSTTVVKKVVYTNVLTIDQYLPAINAVLNEEYTIDEAIKRVEN